MTRLNLILLGILIVCALSLVTSRLGFVHDYLTTPAIQPGFEAFVRAQFRSSFDSLGVDAAANDSDES